MARPSLGCRRVYARVGLRSTCMSFRALRQCGQTILMVEEKAAQALEISDYAYVPM